MSGTLEASFHAMANWLNTHGIDPKSVTVVLRTTDEMSRARLNAALNRWAQHLTIFQPSDASLVQPSPFECYGIKVNVSSLDASR